MTLPDELSELLDFLSNSRLEVRLHALELVRGLTGSADGSRVLVQGRTRLLPSLLHNIAQDSRVSEAALTSLVNLSQDAAVVESLVELRAVQRATDYLREQTCIHEGLLVMLLANLTTSDEGVKALLKIDNLQLQGLDITILMKRFDQWQDPQPDDYKHVADILTNVLRLKEGRKLLLAPGFGTLSVLVKQLRGSSTHRRAACAAAIKNCCLGAKEDGMLDAVLHQEDVLHELLDVLCGVKGPKSEDEAVREQLAEALLVVASNDEGRTVLWRLGAPQMLRKGYEYEEHVAVCEAMEQLAELFMSAVGIMEETKHPGQQINNAQ